MLKKYGALELERKMSKMESYRTYYRRWPFDGTYKLGSIDDIEEIIAAPGPDLQEQMVMKQEVERFMGTLTDKQADIVQKTGEGYKPGQIADLYGENNSGRVRYHKHAAKQKLVDMRARENPEKEG